MIWGIVAAGILVLIYARPYQLATGVISVDGALLGWSGELLVALLFGTHLVAGGAFAHWALKRFYA